VTDPLAEEPAPGPPGRRVTGHLREFRRDPLAFLLNCARQFGDVCRFRLGPAWLHLLSGPEVIEDALVRRFDAFEKGYVRDRREVMPYVLGNGLINSEGDQWQEQRKLIQPLFHAQRIEEYAVRMVACAARLREQWRSGQIRDVHRDMSRLTLDIVADTLLDADLGAAAEVIVRGLDAAMHEFRRRIERPFWLPPRFPVPSRVRFERAISRLDRLVYEMIRHRRLSCRDAGDLISVLLDARHPDGKPWSEREVRDQIVTFIFTGHESTSAALSFTWYLLARHPEVEERLHREIDEMLGDGLPAWRDVERLPYAGAVVRESLRLYPPIWSVTRIPRRQIRIGGWPIPAGTGVIISPWVSHRDARFFSDPDRFWPERWLGGLERTLPRFAYYPFLGGPRVCIGASFGSVEAVLLLAVFAQRFRLRLLPDRPVEAQPTITLRPRAGLWMKLEAR
jgi:cytochrome P450